MQATIDKVFPAPRLWKNEKFPDGASVEGLFQDGSKFELATKTGKANEYIQALTQLIGTPGEFDVEPKDDFQGVKQFKLKSWPGKPEQRGFSGGGGRAYVPAWTQSEEGERYTQERMDRRTALMQAVQAAGILSAGSSIVDEIELYANSFYDWLRQTDQKPPTPSQEPRTAPQPSNGGNPLLSDIWPGPGQCETCHAPEGKRHGKQCIEAVA